MKEIDGDLTIPGDQVRVVTGNLSVRGRLTVDGNLVVLEHRAGMTSWYAHLRTIAVARGQCLPAGYRIGEVGATGRSFGPHLHFELRVRGAVVDPVGGL